MIWTVEFRPKAARQFKKLDQQTQRLIRDFLRQRLQVASDPRAIGSALKGELKSFWLYRVGSYRLICDIHDHTITIEILKIGHRRDIYEH